MYLTQALKRAVQIRGNELATQDSDRKRTWSESLDRISKLAGAIKKLGFNDNDRSAILSLNSDRYFEALYASVWAGGIFVPVNTVFINVVSVDDFVLELISIINSCWKITAMNIPLNNPMNKVFFADTLKYIRIIIINGRVNTSQPI